MLIPERLFSFPGYFLKRSRYWLINDYPLASARIRGFCIDIISNLCPSLMAHKPADGLCVKVMCQVKADSDTIEDWIHWHAYLFGMHNICVIADRPTPETAEILALYSPRIAIFQAPLGDCPLHLSWCEKKTYNLNHAISEFACNADFIFPLDSDEFVIFEDKPDKALILCELQRLKYLRNNAFKFGQEFQSCTLDSTTRPVAEIISFRRSLIDYDGKKCFAKPQELTCIGAGQHYVYSRIKEVALVTRLSLLHYRWRGIKHMYEKCLDHVSQKVVLEDGSQALPRVGDHVRSGAEAIEKGTFPDWAASVVGSPNKRITGLSDYLTNNPR